MKIDMMNKLSLKYFLPILLLGCMVGCEGDEQEVVTLNTLVLAEEFDTNGAPNPELWNFDIGTGDNGWGNQELQYYTNRSENVRVEDGVLKITAIKENFEGSGFTSSRILTKDLFEQQYGRFEARMKLPWGQGIWPAFWMLGADIVINPWPGAGEIDIMEFRGQDPSTVLGSVHGPGYSAGEAITKSYTLTNDRFDTKFHVFGIEWGPNYINFYVDDVLYNQITPGDVTGEWVFNKPFYLLINLAVGGTFVGSPSDNTVFPQTLEVDYVRVYR
ncbi:glycoside hydrolase family 16 protein [Fulvivirga lutea]|uniref:Glycoside hydrolase family 16 protein n=2 Tax=Fulvivirga lutea TaxID=2810512 RepID=A0A974WJK8_9BACT|nr:glycoside hydrolase family 16 protein [Fulvivirga lutea]